MVSHKSANTSAYIVNSRSYRMKWRNGTNACFLGISLIILLEYDYGNIPTPLISPHEDGDIVLIFLSMSTLEKMCSGQPWKKKAPCVASISLMEAFQTMSLCPGGSKLVCYVCSGFANETHTQLTTQVG